MNKLLVGGVEYVEHELSTAEVFFYLGGLEARVDVLGCLKPGEFIKAKQIPIDQDYEDLKDYIKDLKVMKIDINGDFKFIITTDKKFKILNIYRPIVFADNV